MKLGARCDVGNTTRPRPIVRQHNLAQPGSGQPNHSGRLTVPNFAAPPTPPQYGPGRVQVGDLQCTPAARPTKSGMPRRPAPRRRSPDPRGVVDVRRHPQHRPAHLERGPHWTSAHVVTIPRSAISQDSTFGSAPSTAANVVIAVGSSTGSTTRHPATSASAVRVHRPTSASRARTTAGP